MDPFSFEFKWTDFDLSTLSRGGQPPEGDDSKLKPAVQERLQGLFRRLPGEVRIMPHEDHVSVMWVPESSRDIESMLDLVTGLIQQRAFAQAEPILRTLSFRFPDNRRLLLGLGTMLCQQGRLREAREALKRLIRTAPDFAGGWNALGVALSREGRRKEAVDALQKSLALDPDNGSTLRNLGALMSGKAPEKALPHLKRAAKLLPSDQAAQYVYGKCLMDVGNPADADAVLKKTISLNEHSEVADLCREARIKIKRSALRGTVPRGLRTDVVVYCVDALETFKRIGRPGIEAVAFEAASLARGGLNLKDTKSRYRLASLPGGFSALRLTVYMYVAYRKAYPQTDAGADFSREYKLALRILRGKKGKPKPRKQA
ncbi:MAG: tetratricopeptide repeat protein [Thermodesulfobacteriota bacterium]